MEYITLDYNQTPITMKRLFMIAVMTSLAVVTFSQGNTLLWTMTVDVKMDKKLEWEKKMVTFVKAHYPQLKYRAWEVISGDNTGSYVLIVGPTSYKEIGAPQVSPKGEALMRTDAQALDALCNSSEVNYYHIENDISTTKADRKLNYQVIGFTEFTPGTWGDTHNFLARQKEAREKGGSTVDQSYLRPSYSGAPNAVVSVRFVEKMEELDADQNTAEMYDKAFGNNSWYKDWNGYVSNVRNSRSEIRVLRTDLSNF
jgi:hypothetical protein